MAKARSDKRVSEVTTPVVRKPQEQRNIYSYTQRDAPDDLVVNNRSQPIIVQLEARDKKGYPQRIDPGDRRQGVVYRDLVAKGVGLALVGALADERLEELNKIRQIRTGERPEDWVFEARERAERGHDPKGVDNVQRARSNLEIAIRS